MRNAAYWLIFVATVLVNQNCVRAGNLYEPATCKEVVRTGWPWCHWRWARFQNPCDYEGYYVGGGAPGPKGREHCTCEGTWGWDYHGHSLKRFVNLGWTMPARRQGGTGQYQPDGPRVLEAVHEHAPSHRGQR